MTEARFLCRAAVLVCLSAVVSSCGGGGGGGSTPSPVSPTTPVAPTVTSLTVTGPGCTAAVASAGPIRTICGADTVGTTVQLTATATLSDATTQNVTNQALWSTTNGAVATVSNQGLVTIVSNGDADVLATYQGKMGGQTIRAALKPLVKPLLRGTTFQNLPIAMLTEQRGTSPVVDIVSTWAVLAQFTAANGQTAQLTVESHGRADIAADGTFRMTSGDGGFLQGTFKWDGTVSGTFQVSITYQGTRYVVTGAYTAQPSDT